MRRMRNSLRWGLTLSPDLRKHFRAKDSSARSLACMRLASLGPFAEAAAKDLEKVLGDEDIVIRANAASVLSVTSNPPESLVPALRELVNSEQPEYVSMAVVALGNLGADAVDAVPELTALIDSTDKDISVRAARILSMVGPAAKSAIPVLRVASKSDDEKVSAAAEEAIEKIESYPDELDESGELKEQPSPASDGEVSKEPPGTPDFDLGLELEPAETPVPEPKEEAGSEGQ